MCYFFAALIASRIAQAKDKLGVNSETAGEETKSPEASKDVTPEAVESSTPSAPTSVPPMVPQAASSPPAVASPPVPARAPPPPPPSRPSSVALPAPSGPTGDNSQGKTNDVPSASKPPVPPAAARPPPPPPPKSGGATVPPPPTRSTPPPPPMSSVPQSSANVDEEDDPLRKYKKMKEMLPEGAVRQKMMVDGFSDEDITKFLAGVQISVPTAPVAVNVAPQITLKAPSVAPPPGPPKLSLMDEIQRGSKLKAVQAEDPRSKPCDPVQNAGGILGMLAQEMSKRRFNMNVDAEDDDSDSSGFSDSDSDSD